MKLNLGCGTDIRKGWVNLDRSPLPGVDLVHDLNKLPLPFKDGEFEFVLCKDVLEHLDYIPLMMELYRITAPGGIIEIQVPHFTSRINFIDPTHRKRFSIMTFQFFVNESVFRDRNYYFPVHFERIVESRIVFEKGRGFLLYNYILEPLVNLNSMTKNFYEATGLSRLFPAMNIIVKLKK